MDRSFEILDHPIIFQRPRRLTTTSAWKQHIPFAMLLIELVRPDLLVELGTHTGDSYCAFCQAVQELRLPTRCYAVDTWEGDDQAGHYGSEVYEDLNEYHGDLYAGFSCLLRATFDEAVEHFEEGTIDVLHIDGLHTYDAVRHDFETWLPKLSTRGVVLFHDTNVRHGDFGVWRLWAELRTRYPSLEFIHGHGLGVASVGPEEPPQLRAFREAFAADPALQTMFSELGFRFHQQMEIVRERERTDQLLTAQGTELAATKVHARNLEAARDQAVTAQQAALEELEAARSEKDAAQAALREAVESAGAEVGAHAEAARRATQRVAELQSALQQEHASLGYRALRSAREAAHKAAPRSTNRRGLLLLASRGTSALMEGGPGSVRSKLPEFWVWPPRLMDVAKRPAIAAAAGDSAVQLPFAEQYQIWLGVHALTAERLRNLQREAAQFAYQPTISVVMPVYRSDLTWLTRAIESMRSQVYRHWELCIADDASGDDALRRLLRRYRRLDRRIKVTFLKKNQGISGASQQALGLATGEFVGFLDHDDELTPDALVEVARLLNQDRALDFIYTDEDKLDADGRRVEPFFKPDWSPELLMSVNYLCHFSVYRTSVVRRVGGLREGYDGSQDYDLALRVTSETDRIAHLPKVLYSWRKVPGSAAAALDAKPYASAAAKRALRDHLARQGIKGSVEDGSFGTYRVRYALEGTPKVSVIIPTRDRVELLRQSIESIQERSSYPNYEIIVVDNGSTDEQTLEYLDSLAGRVLRDPGEFNFSRMMNLAAAEAKGDALLLLNNDTEVITPDWMEALLELGMRPGVAAVGARLFYPSGRVQHEGVLIGVGGDAGNIDHGDYCGLGSCVRDFSAVTAACMLVRSSVFEELGGFDERLRVAYNDVDFCLRARDKGYRNVYTPYAVLTHHESASRGRLHPSEDTRVFRNRWGEPGEYIDPYYNVNFSPNHPFKIRVESRG